jgi:hypothetical protein
LFESGKEEMMKKISTAICSISVIFMTLFGNVYSVEGIAQQRQILERLHFQTIVQYQAIK